MDNGITRRYVGLAVTICCLASCDGTDTIDEHSFIRDYRISHYLDVAVKLQELDALAREKAIADIACDRKRASEVYPLCRMLFEAKDKQVFRRPAIGGARFLGGTTYADWPLEPITVYQGAPILIVRGYFLGGKAEPPGSYVQYCLKNCKWREEKYNQMNQGKRREILAQFIASHPKLAQEELWLRQQAE
jgi:hypothetical protein